MIGNQAIINGQLLNHPDNPIKDKINDIDVDKIIYVITDEYWKSWRRQLVNSPKPRVKAIGLGDFTMMYGKSKSYLRRMLGKIRNIKRKYPDTYLKEGTMANGLYVSYITRFRTTWMQVDEIKKEVNRNLEIWKQKKIAKYGDKAIL